jgi:hypothetical protein
MVVAGILVPAASAHATPIFSQTPTVVTAFGSDPTFPAIEADDFSLTSADIVKSVFWQGIYDPAGTPLR